MPIVFHFYCVIWCVEVLLLGLVRLESARFFFSDALKFFFFYLSRFVELFLSAWQKAVHIN